MDIIALIWLTLWFSLFSCGFYILSNDHRGVTANVYYYGKSLSDLQKQQQRNKKGHISNQNYKKELFWNLFLVPKRFFSHFYLTALFLAFLPSLATVLVYYTPASQPNHILLQFLGTLSSFLEAYNITVEVDGSLSSITEHIFTLILMTIQLSRRLYECIRISVYSSHSKINLIHYVYGHIFYLLAALSTVLPILLSKTTQNYTLHLILDSLITKYRALGFVLFIIASLNQQECHKTLANLRKDKGGKVITEQHYVPSGGLFEYVSCPHFLLEVLLYLIILIVQKFQFLYWNLIFLLVITTQTMNALTEHKWYKKNYKDFPQERKAICPKLL